MITNVIKLPSQQSRLRHERSCLERYCERWDLIWIRLFLFGRWTFARNSGSILNRTWPEERSRANVLAARAPRRTGTGGRWQEDAFITISVTLLLPPRSSPCRLLSLYLSLPSRSVSSSPPLFLALSVTLPFEVSVLLPTAGAEAVTTIIVSEVTSLKHREEEKEHDDGDEEGGGCEARTRGGERADWPIYRTGNKHRAAGVDPSGYRRVYTVPVISSREVAFAAPREPRISTSFRAMQKVQRVNCATQRLNSYLENYCSRSIKLIFVKESLRLI